MAKQVSLCSTNTSHGFKIKQVFLSNEKDTTVVKCNCTSCQQKQGKKCSLAFCMNNCFCKPICALFNIKIAVGVKQIGGTNERQGQLVGSVTE